MSLDLGRHKELRYFSPAGQHNVKECMCKPIFMMLTRSVVTGSIFSAFKLIFFSRTCAVRGRALKVIAKTWSVLLNDVQLCCTTGSGTERGRERERRRDRERGDGKP